MAQDNYVLHTSADGRLDGYKSRHYHHARQQEAMLREGRKSIKQKANGKVIRNQGIPC